MSEPPQNVVLTGPASQVLRAEFLGWQCRIRQLAAREQGGRPSGGMRPRVLSSEGEPLSAGIVTLIVETEPENSTQQFRFEYLQTQDPHERYDRILRLLRASYFQEPSRFGDAMTALFTGGSVLAKSLLERGRCVLEFEQYTQGYRLPCEVTRLAVTHRLYQATYWHNRLFNPRQPAEIEVLCFKPDWTHARSFRRNPDAT
jgi:hypothetical protein